MRRALTAILLIVASIHSSVITPRWHEGGYTGSFAPYLRDRDNGNPYAGFIMQCGVRSVVYQNYGLYYPPQPPPPAPKQKDVHDIVHHPENCKDWSADDFYNAIKSVYAAELIPYPDDYKYPSYRSDNCSDFNIEHFLIYSDHRGSHYATSEQCKKLMLTDGLFGYNNFWTCIREKIPFGCFLIGHAYRYEDQSLLSKKSRERLYKEYKKIEKEYWDLYYQRDREGQEWIDEIRAFGESVKEKLNQSFDELYQEKEAYVEQEEWLERYACGNAQRIKDRIAALEDIKSTGMQYASKQYQLSPQAQDAIQKAGYRKLKYIYSGGNQLQHVIHQDCVNLIEEIIVIPNRSIAHPYTNALLTCTNSAREYNMFGDLRKAMDITDFCWSLIDHGKNLIAQAAYAVTDAASEYGKAIGHGCIGGAVGAITGIAQEAYDHPWQTLASVVAGEAMFSFAIGKLIVNVADIGITYCCIDTDKGIKKFEEFVQPITDLITALTQAQQQGGAQTIQCVTHIATQLCAQALLFKGMTQFCDVLKSKALTFAKNNPLVSFDAYAQTPDGSVIKVSTENIRTQVKRKSIHKPDCHCYDTPTRSPIREVVLPQVDTYSKAQKKAWEILGKVDHQTAIPYVGKKGVCKDKLIGMGWHNNKAVIRLDWDGVKGPHINVVDYRLNKGINGVSFAIPFKGSEKSLNKLLNHLNTETCLENARQFFKKTKNDVSLSKIEHTISELAKPRREREVIEICKRKY